MWLVYRKWDRSCKEFFELVTFTILNKFVYTVCSVFGPNFPTQPTTRLTAHGSDSSISCIVGLDALASY